MFTFGQAVNYVDGLTDNVIPAYYVKPYRVRGALPNEHIILTPQGDTVVFGSTLEPRWN